MSFTNVYYKRTTGSPRACYVCYKPTTTVLATINTVDFLYTCPSHLEDRGFAAKLGGVDGSKETGVSEEEIANIKAEWEEKQKRKAEKEKEKEKEKEADKDKDKDKPAEDGSKKKPSPRGSPKPAEIPSPKSPTPSHEQYALHRNFFAMRQAEHRKRRQAANASALAPRLPGAPSGEIKY